MSQAVILAGGKGTRLAEKLDGLPKALVDVDGVPLLERQIRHLTAFGITDIVILVNHCAQRIGEYVARRASSDARIRLIDDGHPRGTAGAVLSALDQFADRFVVVYGDTLISVDLPRMLQAHARRQADITILLHPSDHRQDCDIVEVDPHGRVLRFYPYPHRPGEYLPNLVNAALYVVDRQALASYRATPVPADFAKNLFPQMLKDGARIFGYTSFEYIKDLGTPARLHKVERDLRTGVVERARLSVPQKAVFVDRDGTLNVHRGLINDPDQLELLAGVAAGIRRLNEHEFRVVVVTNQPVVARGEASLADLRRIHNKLETLLAEEGAYVDAIYFCPHHPDRGFEGEVPELKIQCSCRKPKTGLIDQAVTDLNIDLRRSWMIGDTSRDIAMAETAGVRSIFLETGVESTASTTGRPDAVCRAFSDAVDRIVSSPERAP